LPGVEACSAFTKEERGRIDALKRGRGWVRCKDSWNPEEKRAYGALREKALGLGLNACRQTAQAIGYENPGEMVAFGTKGTDSDIDINFKPNQEMPEVHQALLKVIFDMIFLSVFEATPDILFDISFYLKHPADKDECDPLDDWCYSMQTIAAAWERPDILDDPETAAVIEKSKEATFGKSDSLSEEQRLKKMQSILTLSHAIDRLEAELKKLPASESEKRHPLELEIARLKTFRICFFDESYKANATFYVVCGASEGQQQDATLMAPLMARVAEGTPRSFAEIIQRAPTQFYGKPGLREFLISCIENWAMFLSHLEALVSDGKSPQEALITESKYLLRMFKAMEPLLEELSSQEGPGIAFEEIAKLRTPYTRLMKFVQDLERCKRNQLPPSVFRAQIEIILTEVLGTKEKENIEFLGNFMETLLFTLVVDDTHIGLFLPPEDQADMLFQHFDCMLTSLFSTIPPDLLTEIRGRSKELCSAATGIAFSEDLRRKAYEQRVATLAQKPVQEYIGEFRECAVGLRRLCAPSITQEAKKAELAAIEKLFS
jgi:hypothetical protein